MSKRFDIPEVTAQTPLAVAAPALLLAKADPLFELEGAARGGADMDAVHDMRVASRRLREALRLLEPVYPRKEYQKWYRRVRRITRALGPVRDSDVFIDTFSRLGEHLGEGGRRTVAFMVGYRTGQRVAELERLNAELGHLDLDRNRARFAAFARRVNPAVDGARLLAAFAHAAVAERASIVFGAQPAALSEENTLAQHALRIDYKRLRYAVEAFAPCYNDAFDDLHETLTAFQDTLGELHDVHVFLDMLRDPERIAAAGRGGVLAADLTEVVELLEERAHEEYLRFAALVAEHPAEQLLPRLLLPLTVRPLPEVEQDTAGETPEVIEEASGQADEAPGQTRETPVEAGEFVLLDPGCPALSDAGRADVAEPGEPDGVTDAD